MAATPGPGAFTLGWLKNDREVYFQSEKSGYSQLYAVAYEGGEPRALTSGKWEITAAQLSKDKSRFYLTTSEVGPEERQVYAMDANGGPRTRLTVMPGSHAAVVSPDERWMADLYFVHQQTARAVRGKDQARRAVQETDVPPHPSSGSIRGWMRLKISGPVHEYHGRPAARSWRACRGVRAPSRHPAPQRSPDIDYRGSAGYGRDWRTAIYEHMGGKDLDDNVDAVRWLVSHEGVDARRIGLYGGSRMSSRPARRCAPLRIGRTTITPTLRTS